MGRSIKSGLLIALLLFSASAWSDQIRIATASNFSAAMRALAHQFEIESGQSVVVITGSTGKQYAQIVNGAPFDAFFAADTERPRLLEQSGQIAEGTRFTYARGRLVLWSSQPGLVDPQGRVLSKSGFNHLAMANPRLAPYGVAAREVLEHLNLWDQLAPKLVRGENIAQTFQFVGSGNAQLGFIAWSQLVDSDRIKQGSLWDIPTDLYHPIDQQAVLLNNQPGARAFISFVRGPAGSRIIQDYGYQIPDAD